LKRFFVFSTLAVIILVISNCSTTYKNIQASLPDLNNMQNGIYHGAYSLPKSPLSAVLDVTVENHILTKISIIEHNCSPVGKKAENIIEKIIEHQSLGIDAISGATASSKTILMAVQNALQ
jgi:uncharacterized protein with FMN-binding domain